MKVIQVKVNSNAVIGLLADGDIIPKLIRGIQTIKNWTFENEVAKNKQTNQNKTKT